MTEPKSFQDQILEYEKQEVCPHGSTNSFLFTGLDFPSGRTIIWEIEVCNECNKTLEQKRIMNGGDLIQWDRT